MTEGEIKSRGRLVQKKGGGQILGERRKLEEGQLFSIKMDSGRRRRRCNMRHTGTIENSTKCIVYISFLL